jgi:hypothetical protein
LRLIRLVIYYISQQDIIVIVVVFRYLFHVHYLIKYTLEFIYQMKVLNGLLGRQLVYHNNLKRNLYLQYRLRFSFFYTCIFSKNMI